MPISGRLTYSTAPMASSRSKLPSSTSAAAAAVVSSSAGAGVPPLLTLLRAGTGSRPSLLSP